MSIFNNFISHIKIIISMIHVFLHKLRNKSTWLCSKSVYTTEFFLSLLQRTSSTKIFLLNDYRRWVISSKKKINSWEGDSKDESTLTNNKKYLIPYNKNKIINFKLREKKNLLIRILWSISSCIRFR